jgi:CheY-like chemotaxis protein
MNSDKQTPDLFHVHVVDDETEVLGALVRLVEAIGYVATGSSSGEAALAFLSSHKVDLVITDLMMPDMTGWQLLRQIKESQPDIEVVVVTGFVPENAQEMLTNGDLSGYLVKPVDAALLTTLLKGLLYAENLGRQAEAVILDDDPEALAAMKAALERRGIFCDCYTEAKAALDRLIKKPADLALIDYLLPDDDGFHVAEQLRADPDTRYMPILMITSSPTTDVVQRAVESRIDAFLAKPFDPQILGDRVVQALRYSIP